MGRGEKTGERFLLIAYYVQATVPGVVSRASGDQVIAEPHEPLCQEAKAGLTSSASWSTQLY